MKATDQLKAEHEGILTMLKILDRICLRLESGEAVDVTHLEQIVAFFRVFVDRCHHGKEERFLFPALEIAGVPREGGPLGQMLLEHDQGRDYIKGMAAAIAELKDGKRDASLQIVKHAREYIRLLEAHISKENLVLFPVADSRLSEESQGSLYEQFEDLEEQEIGRGTHEEFHKLLDNFAELYLKENS